MSYIAELREVTKIFDGITALEDVSLQIREGEILALLGPSGSGKTTLLKILAFLEKPSKGDVYFLGRKAAEMDLEQLRRETTMVFQRPVIFNTTVYNNIAYGLKIRKTPKAKIDDEVRRALRLVKLEGFESRHAKRLSGGEQRRVALAMALALNTKLLLLDEPTADLDPKNASIIEEVIATVNRELKTTVVMATHNMFQAKSLPHRVALMSYGRISEVGTPGEVFSKLSEALVSFAGLENTFIGEARIAEDGTTLIDIGNGMEIVAAARQKGKVSVFVSPADIILSRGCLASSARNVFKGRIVEISDLGPVMRLKIDAGKTFAVQITRRSFDEMGLNLGMEVYMTFKASSVKIV